MNKVIIFILVLALSACGSGNNVKGRNIDDGFYLSKDFTVHCLHGYKYLIRVVDYLSLMAPKFDSSGNLERCTNINE